MTLIEQLTKWSTADLAHTYANGGIRPSSDYGKAIKAEMERRAK